MTQSLSEQGEVVKKVVLGHVAGGDVVQGVVVIQQIVHRAGVGDSGEVHIEVLAHLPDAPLSILHSRAGVVVVDRL